MPILAPLLSSNVYKLFMAFLRQLITDVTVAIAAIAQELVS